MSTEARFLSLPDLESYKSLGSAIFPGEDWDSGIKRVARIIAQWKEGILGVWLDKQLVAYITLYPITAEAANNLKNGTLSDSQIDSHILPSMASTIFQYWICTSVVITVNDPVIRTEVRNKIVDHLFAVLKQHSPCEVYAHAVTESGRRFCGRLGFRFEWPSIPDLCCIRHP